jgi:hypothetical protein
MSRHRFRSQPTLARSSASATSAVIGVGLLVGIGVGAGAWLGTALKGASPDSQHIYAAGPLDRPAVVSVAAAPPPAPPAVQHAASEAPAALPQVVLAKTRPPMRRIARAPSPVVLPVLKPLSPQEQWERKKTDYEIARAAYDENERSAGYRWAEQNNIKVPRYCRLAVQRTSAFAEGCISYLQAAHRPRAPDDKAIAPPPSLQPDQG